MGSPGLVVAAVMFDVSDSVDIDGAAVVDDVSAKRLVYGATPGDSCVMAGSGQIGAVELAVSLVSLTGVVSALPVVKFEVFPRSGNNVGVIMGARFEIVEV